MPLQNRVTPFGEIVAHTSRGSFMGNRGILHDDNRTLGARRWTHQNWVTCALSFKGDKRPLMKPGNYTELFFLDEATAFAAGHRPCAECRRADYNRFVAAWIAAQALQKRPVAQKMDRQLHRGRVSQGVGKITYKACENDLPDGTMVSVDGSAYLIWSGHRFPWSFISYGEAVALRHSDVEVLTPRATVWAFAAGYLPQVHPTAIS